MTYSGLGTGFGGTYITDQNYNYSGIGSGRVKYEGCFYLSDQAWPGTGIDFTNLSLNLGLGSPLIPGLGTLENKVWDSTKPKIEQGGLFVAIAEIRDVPHMLKTSLEGFIDIYKHLGGKPSFRRLPKKIANHFLNHNFGWVPFISDVQKFIGNIQNSSDRISRLERDNGQWIRRKVLLVNQTEDTDLGWGERSFVDPGSNYFIQGCYIPTWKPYYNIKESKFTLAEGVGRFRYYLPYFDKSLPDANSALGALQQQLALHGARATPVNIYKAVPWTWLLDWISDAGRSLQAIQDANLDGMAAKYLYLVHHQVKTHTLRQFLPFGPTNGGIKELQYSRVIDVKQRKEADAPFGFGLSWDDLSPKQLAILAALGISRH
jgi:hypothetical protein